MTMHGVPSEISPARERDEMMVPCRCCGRPLVDQLSVEEVIVAAALPRKLADILRILARARGNWLTSYEIAADLYADDIDGGPTSVPVTICQSITRLKRRLRQFGDKLALQGGQQGSRLVAVPESKFYVGYRYGGRR